MNTNKIEKATGSYQVAPKLDAMGIFMNQIAEIGHLPDGAYVSSLYLQTDNDQQHFKAAVSIRGKFVKENQYTAYYKNYRGEFQTRADVYHFEWDTNSAPELVSYVDMSKRRNLLTIVKERPYLMFK